MSAPACPLCGRRDARSRWRRGAERIWGCRGCGLMFRHPRACELDLDPIQRRSLPGYADLATRRSEHAAIQATRAAHIQALAAAGTRPRLLDVGAAAGALADALGQGARYTGIEPDPALRAAAPAGLDLRPWTLDQAEFPPCSFEAVVICDVLEHLRDPLGDLRRAASWLVPGGAVYVEVPDEERLRLRATLRRLTGATGGLPTHPAHLCLFTARTLEALLRAAGLQEVRVERRSIWGDATRVGLVLPGPRVAHRLLARAVDASAIDRRLGLAALVGVGRSGEGAR